MSTQTEKLGLFKYDPVVDKEELFDIQTSLNDNWDKIDKAVGSFSQADWNQNDTEAKDYVKNRTHYVDQAFEATTIADLSVATDEFRKCGYISEAYSNTFLLELGTTYRVTIDGVSYITTVWQFTSSMYALGNAEYYGLTHNTDASGGDTNCPFCISMPTRDGSEVILHTGKTNTTHTVSIDKVTESIVKLDEKFLPDTVATKEYVDSAIGAAIGGSY